MAAPSDGRRGEEDDSLLQQCQLPEDKQLGPKVMEKLTETASRVNDLRNNTTLLMPQTLSLSCVCVHVCECVCVTVS